ncbi:MAG: PhoX family phosphatase [Polaromonas sp.]|nr:PhoX family phosphatase [Polaromonas sp.]
MSAQTTPKLASCVSSIDPDDLDNNPSSNTSIHDVMAQRLNRRHLLRGGVSAMAVAGLGAASLTACGGGDSSSAAAAPAPVPTPVVTEKILGFSAVAKDLADQLALAPGYTATVIYATGDSIDIAVSDYKNDGTDDNFARRSGDHHDGMQYFGLSADGTRLDPTNNDRALLVMNHENIAGTVQFMHAAGQTNASSGVRPEAEAIKEIEAHGVSVIEIQRTAGKFALNKNSLFNLRITASTPMDINGPVRATDFVKTAYSPTGTKTRGTINNCANGYTPWGTYLTCEENWAGYFRRDTTDDANRTAKELVALARVGLSPLGTSGATLGLRINANGNNRWSTAAPSGGTSATEFSRWNANIDTATTAVGDFRNGPNTFGWTVEIDPFKPLSTPRKRTAMGRFAHEGAWPSNLVAGKPIAFYMGDDSRGEYIYKFVSTANWNAADANGGLAAGDKYLDAGTLYAAKFNADGTGGWVKLDLSNAAISGATTPYAFASLADVLVNTRLAADAAGATKMDRPEWTAVNPANGEIYITCTENPDRGNTGQSSNNNANPALDAANPRYWFDNKAQTNNVVLAQKGNVNGHIMRMRETADDAAATTFSWDIFLFGAQSKADAGIDDVNYQANVNLSGLSGFNDLSKPDGCWFSRASGILWIETDDNTFTDQTNCMLLAAIPGSMGDGGAVTVVNKANGSPTATVTTDVSVTTRMGKQLGDTKFKRFLTAPKGSEVTGLSESPDGKALFINIQHPGENTGNATNGAGTAFPAGPFESNWPGNGRGVAAYGPGGASARPRSATVMITKNDGGIIGL